MRELSENRRENKREKKQSKAHSSMKSDIAPKGSTRGRPSSGEPGAPPSSGEGQGKSAETSEPISPPQQSESGKRRDWKRARSLGARAERKGKSTEKGAKKRIWKRRARMCDRLASQNVPNPSGPATGGKGPAGYASSDELSQKILSNNRRLVPQTKLLYVSQTHKTPLPTVDRALFPDVPRAVLSLKLHLSPCFGRHQH